MFKGQQEENKAALFLEQQGLKVLTKNFRCKQGEIDIIALSHSGLHFIEVKARKNANFGHPSEFITQTKQSRIHTCSLYYLKQHPKITDYQIQFDAIIILGNDIEWLQNVF